MEYPTNYTDLLEFISSKPRETDTLVFLDATIISKDSKKPEKLARVVSALANQGNCTIYCGVVCRRGRAVEIQAIETNKTDGWMLHEIQACIKPKVRNLKLISITTPDGGVVYKIEIPEHNSAPHMWTDLRYYRWYKRKPIALEEHEIRLLYGASATPDVEYIGLYNTNGLPVLTDGFMKTISFYPKLLVQNRGGGIEKDYKIEIHIPSELHDTNFIALQSKLTRHEGIHSVFSLSGNSPIFQDEIINPLEVKILVNSDTFHIFQKEDLIIKVYFSKGVKTYYINLAESFTYNGKKLSKQDFLELKSLD